MRKYVRGWVLCALALLAVSSAAAQVSGKLVLGGYKPPAEKASPGCYWELENGVKEVRPDRVDAPRELAVVLTGEGEPAAGMDRVEVPFSGGSLLPSTIVLRNGATVLFRNDDEFAHELYGEGLEGLPAEATSPRGRRSFQATEAGSWLLRDKVIAHLSAQLIVLPDVVAVATPTADGSFTFPELKPGKYTLKVFHGAKELASQPVEVGDRALTLDPIALTAGASGDTNPPAAK
jgi:hypothetical protein